MTRSERPRRLNLQQRSALAGEAAAAAAEVENALMTPSDLGAAAFFDVDNTVMQGASIFHLARGMHRRNFFTTREILAATWKQAYFRIAGVEDPEHVTDARNSALAFIAGHTTTELEEATRAIKRSKIKVDVVALAQGSTGAPYLEEIARAGGGGPE